MFPWKKTISIVDSIVPDRVVSDGIKTFFRRQKTFWKTGVKDDTNQDILDKLTLDETRDITQLLET